VPPLEPRMGRYLGPLPGRPRIGGQCRHGRSRLAESFGELLRRLRIGASLTQEALAERARLSSDGIAAISQGRRVPRLSTLRLISDALNLSPEDRALLSHAAQPSEGDGRTSGAGAASGGVRPSGGGPRSASPRRHGLPLPLTPLFGRVQETGVLAHALASERLVTLVGPGGVGKTRLALAVAMASFDNFGGGTWWVELGSVQDPGGVAVSVLRSFGLSEQPGSTFADQLVAVLPEGRSLLVVDNCEHVLDAAANLIGELLGHASLTVLATSRERLGIPGEIRWPVMALAVPPVQSPVLATEVAGVCSVQMLVERATRANPDFALTDANSGAVARICRRLDGVPLALELVAARVNSIGVDRLADELEDQVPLSRATARGVPPRHSTLLACIDWSYELLSDEEKRAFRCLAAFAGSFSAEAFRAVVSAAAGSSPWAATAALAALVEKSLVQTTSPPGRYNCLETVRTFAADRALEASELEAVYDAHGECYSTWLAGLGTADASDEVLEMVAGEFPNIRAALVRSIGNSQPRALALVTGLGMAWHEQARFHDARVLGDGALAVPGTNAPDWARAVGALGSARRMSGDVDFGDVVSRAQQVARGSGDRLVEAQCLFISGLGAPFDTAALTSAHELSTAVPSRVVAAATAVALACGGTDLRQDSWLELAGAEVGLLRNSSLTAAYELARADSLMERGRLSEALAAAHHASSLSKVMPLNRLRGIGHILQIALLSHESDMDAVVAEVSGELAGVWPLGGDWHRSTWTALAGLLRLWSRLLQGEATTDFDIGDLARMNRFAVTPSVVRLVCRAEIDRGGQPRPLATAAGTGPPEPGSLMAASVTSVEAALAALAGEHGRAKELWSDVLDRAVRHGYVLLACDALEGLGCAAHSLGGPAPAAQFLGAARRKRHEIGYRHRFRFELRQVEAAWATVRDSPGAQSSPSWREAVDEALGTGALATRLGPGAGPVVAHRRGG
jgi:predicted ATPase/transcriptional regulator with XRE-family HTH domain